MLVNICVCGVDSTLKFKSKITDTSKDLSFADFLRTTKLDDVSYLSKIYKRCLSVVAPIVTEWFGVPWTSNCIWAKGIFKRLELICFSFSALILYCVPRNVSFQRWMFASQEALFWSLKKYVTSLYILNTKLTMRRTFVCFGIRSFCQ